MFNENDLASTSNDKHDDHNEDEDDRNGHMHNDIFVTECSKSFVGW